MDDEHIGVAHGLPLAFGRDIADAHAVVQHQLGHVDGDVLGDVRWQTVDDQVAVDEVHDACLSLDALGLAGEADRDGHTNDLVHGHAIKVGVQHLVRDRVQQVLLDQHARVASAVEP